MAISDKGLGRLPAKDPRDTMHLMVTRVPARIPQPTRYWNNTTVLNQGSTPECVGYAWAGFLASAPLMHKNLPGGYPHSIYERAQTVDEWDGTGYDGTSVRAGAKVLKDMDNKLTEYVWAFDVSTLQRFVLTRGPAVIGINWYEQMFYPQKGGYLALGGGLAGGHAILVSGYSEGRKAFRLTNSWGREWGEQGRAWLHFGDMDRLLSEDGEACSAIERKA